MVAARVMVAAHFVQGWLELGWGRLFDDACDGDYAFGLGWLVGVGVVGLDGAFFQGWLKLAFCLWLCLVGVFFAPCDPLAATLFLLVCLVDVWDGLLGWGALAGVYDTLAAPLADPLPAL
ncbi:hypothetical protein Tco_0415657 [Tanacetum coccineum]